MGCDIHMVLEKRWTDDGEPRWVGVNAFPYVKASMYVGDSHVEGHVRWEVDRRNYALFAAMAGVRGEGPPPRGVPSDVSDLALMESEAWGEDGHSHTWLLLSEALPLFLEHGALGRPDKAVLDAFKRGTTAALESYIEHFYTHHGDEASLDDFRLIIWFDN